MERKRQREIAIGVLAVLIVAIAIYRIRTFTVEPAAAGSTPVGAVSRQQQQTQVGQVPPVDLEALKGERPQPVDSSRDPFRFKPTAPPPAPPPQLRPPNQPDPNLLPTGPVGPPPPPRITLKYIGILETGKTGLIAIFSDGRGSPFYGKQGDIIEGRYQILRIGVESVDLAYLDGRGRQTIRQTGQ
jgi:hypothetical protein